MGLVEKAVGLLRRVDEMVGVVPEPSLRGSERFLNTRDWQILKWMGVVTLGVGVGGLVVGMYDPTPSGLGVSVGMGIGLFGGIAAANRIIDE